MKQIIFICAIGTILFSGCTSKVKPWEKGVLAEKNMQLGGGDGPSKRFMNMYLHLKKEVLEEVELVEEVADAIK